QTRNPSPFGSAFFITPDSADSAGNGTRICPSSFLPIGAFSSFFATANSQRPLRFCHSLPTLCGRGYWGSTLSVFPSLAQRVSRGPLAGRQSAPLAAVVPPSSPRTQKAHTNRRRRIRIMVFFSRRLVGASPVSL